jgi:hypothetical protein
VVYPDDDDVLLVNNTGLGWEACVGIVAVALLGICCNRGDGRGEGDSVAQKVIYLYIIPSHLVPSFHDVLSCMNTVHSTYVYYTISVRGISEFQNVRCYGTNLPVDSETVHRVLLLLVLYGILPVPDLT